MKINANGVTFDNYRSASPGVFLSSFTDAEGATLLIDTAILVRMYELCKFDLERRSGWAAVMERAAIKMATLLEDMDSSNDGLGLLPKAAMVELDPYGGIGTLEWYDAEQMRAYAARAVAAERERCAANAARKSNHKDAA